MLRVKGDADSHSLLEGLVLHTAVPQENHALPQPGTETLEVCRGLWEAQSQPALLNRFADSAARTILSCCATSLGVMTVGTSTPPFNRIYWLQLGTNLRVSENHMLSLSLDFILTTLIQRHMSVWGKCCRT